jgi:hypothetical protein
MSFNGRKQLAVFTDDLAEEKRRPKSYRNKSGVSNGPSRGSLLQQIFDAETVYREDLSDMVMRAMVYALVMIYWLSPASG